MTTLAYTLLVLFAFFFCYWMVAESQSQKKYRRSFSKLTIEESYLLGCLMLVKPTSIYGESIFLLVRKEQDDAKLKKYIQEITQSTLENPTVMHTILGNEAFQAIWQHGAKGTKIDVKDLS